MEIFDAVNLICGVNGERNSVKAFSANDTAKALRMIWLSSRPQDPLKNWLQANRTLFQRIQVIFLAKRMSFKGIERFSLQINLTFMASEARDVINVFHGSASRSFADGTVAFYASAVVIWFGVGLMHWLNQQVGECVNLRFLIDHRQTLHRRAVAAHAVDVRCVKWVVWARRHLRRWTGVDGFIDGLVGGWILWRRPVNSVVIRVSLIFHLMMMIGRHISDTILVIIGRRQNRCRITVWASITVSSPTKFTVRRTYRTGRRRKFFIILIMLSVDVEGRRRSNVRIDQLARLINLILTKILVELHFLPVRIKVLVKLHDLFPMFQRFLLQLKFDSVVKRRLAEFSLILGVCVNVRIVGRCSDQWRVRWLANLADVLASWDEWCAAVARCFMLKLEIHLNFILSMFKITFRRTIQTLRSETARRFPENVIKFQTFKFTQNTQSTIFLLT